MGKTVVFDGKMGMRKFGSAAPPFGKVVCAVKVTLLRILLILRQVKKISINAKERINKLIELYRNLQEIVKIV